MCPMLLDRRSYLGLFVRRARLSYEMLLDHERTELVALCLAWRDGRESALIDEWQGTSSRLTQVQAPARAFRQWRESERRGDYTATKNDLRAFFDYTLPGCDQELHQHALLNLARFHMHTEGWDAARTVRMIGLCRPSTRPFSSHAPSATPSACARVTGTWCTLTQSA